MPGSLSEEYGCPRGLGLVSWRLPDGTEIRCEGIAVNEDALREFVLRFMSSTDGWDAQHWDENVLRAAFEERFGGRVVVEREELADGGLRVVVKGLDESGEERRHDLIGGERAAE